MASVNITPQQVDWYLIIQATMSGTSKIGDIAIDDFSLDEGPCPNDTTMEQRDTNISDGREIHISDC